MDYSKICFVIMLPTGMARLAQALQTFGRDAAAAAHAREGLTAIAPFLERHPQPFGDLVRPLGRDYLAAGENAGAEPDQALLGRTA